MYCSPQWQHSTLTHSLTTCSAVCALHESTFCTFYFFKLMWTVYLSVCVCTYVYVYVSRCMMLVCCAWVFMCECVRVCVSAIDGL